MCIRETWRSIVRIIHGLKDPHVRLDCLQHVYSPQVTTHIDVHVLGEFLA